MNTALARVLPIDTTMLARRTLKLVSPVEVKRRPETAANSANH